MINRTDIFLTFFFIHFGFLVLGQSAKFDSIQRFNKSVDSFEISGKYEGTICFRSNECCTTKLLLEKNNSFVMKLIGNNHGRKNKSTYRGQWIIEGDILVLTQTEMKSNKDFMEPEKYKIFKGDLWYYSQYELIEIALERK